MPRKALPEPLPASEAAPRNEPATGDLSILVRVAELGSLSAVARARNVPVSQVSRAITRLERDYQVRLINRSTHGLSVTPEGEIFLAHARRVVESIAELGEELDTRTGEPVGLVRLSVSQVMGDAQIVPSLPALADRYPGLKLDLLADDALVDLVTEGVDLAVRTNLIENENLVARQVGEYGRALYASPAYLERHGTPAYPDDISQHRCITHVTRSVFNKWQFRIGGKTTSMSIPGTWRANNSSIVLSMVLQGLGIARLNTAIAGPFTATGELVHVLDEFREPTRSPINIVMLPDRHRLPKIRACVEHLTELYARLGPY